MEQRSASCNEIGVISLREDIVRAAKVVGKLMAAASLIGLIAGCGGDSGSGGSVGGGTGVIITPTPVPLPPTTPPPPPLPSIPRLVGAMPGESLGGLLACAKDPAVVNSQGHVTGLPVLTGAKIDNTIMLRFNGTDSYAVVDINGFGAGSAFAPTDKRTSPTVAFDQFLSGGSEFYIARNNSLSGSRTFATHGLLNEYGSLCFFAAGLPAASLPTSGIAEYGVVVDGIAQIGGQTQRLLPSFSGSSLVVNFATRTASLELNLSGRANAFEEFGNQPSTTLTSASASLQFQGGGAGATALSGIGGFSGTVRGLLVGDTQNTSGFGGSGAVFTFELRNAAGDVIFGVLTAERNLI